jgi:hypothetical protein
MLYNVLPTKCFCLHHMREKQLVLVKDPIFDRYIIYFTSNIFIPIDF